MDKVIVIQMGSGSLQDGFPLVTAQFWDHPGAMPEQFTGALPPAPHLQTLMQSWQALYRALCIQPGAIGDIPSAAAPRSLVLSDEDDEFEIETGGVQNVSSYDFTELCQSLSEQFNHWLWQPEFGSIERPLRSHLSIPDSIRIILATENDAIRRLPWQRWKLLKDFPGAEVALSLPQYRRQSHANPTRHQPRILAILGSTQGIDLAQEQHLLGELPHTEVTFLIQPTRQEFNQALWDAVGWDLLFFAGHSTSEDDHRGRLYINDRDQNSLTMDELSEALTAALEKGLQLAIFNSCDGLGLAHQLAHLNIPQVIVMREPVPNRVAQQFFQSFLQAYVQQAQPLYGAIKQARRQLQGIEDDFPGASWLPVLCQNPAEVPHTWADLCQPTSQPTSAPSSALSRQDYRDRKIFLNKIRHAWIKGVLNKSLPSTARLTMGLVEQPDLVQAVAISTAQPAGYPLPLGTSVPTYFEQLGLGRSLLLLGQPGAGKTIALLDLAETLLEQAEQDGQAPLPVVLNLSTWGTQRTKPSIQHWLQQSLSRYYQVPQKVAEQWLQSAQITLLLDGLDEVPEERRRLCIQALNQFRLDYRHIEMVVSSRQDPYETAAEYLTLQTALILQPLAEGQIEDYCLALGDQGSPLQSVLAGDALLQQLATSPLLLNIIAVSAADVHSDPPQIHPSDPASLEDRRHRLLNTYIDRMLSRRSGDHLTSAAATITGLRFLAQQLQASGQSVFQIEAIQPRWLDKRLRKTVYPLLLGITLATLQSTVPAMVGLWLGGIWVALSIVVSWGLIGGCISGFIGGWLGGLTGGLIGGSLSTLWLWMLIPRFTIGVITTPLLALFMSFIFGACQERIEPVESFRWSWLPAVRWLLLGLGVGAMLSLPLYLAGNVEGRVLIPAVGFIFMLLQGFAKQSHLNPDTIRPNEGLWRTGQNAVRIGLISAVVYGLLCWVLFGLNTGGDWRSYQDSLPFGAIAGGIMGTTMGLVGAEGSGVVCIQHWVLRLMLWQQKRIPWNYAQFLDGCASRILLRKVGGSYIFIHRLLLEHFAHWRPSR
ncbi:CHAT domain-containing protein [Acaryochloris marina NIES-2412]|uniref:CHAT domain-containing protein n=1 Tax=Acaryochloris marina TaxID=155978 RepID=UPI0040589F23